MSQVIVVVALCICFFHNAAALRSPPHIHVDLDAPPALRWANALETVLAVHPWEFGFAPAFAAHNASLFNQLNASHYTILVRAMRTHWSEQADELTFLASRFAAAGHPEVTFSYLCAWVFFHELDHTDLHRLMPGAAASPPHRACTGIVAQDATHGVTHVANMDQSPPSIRNVTLRVTFTRGDTVVAEAVDWYWFTTGMTRMVAKRSVSLQENWRFSDPPLDHDVVLAAIAAGATPHVFYARSLLLNTASSHVTFNTAVEALSTMHLAAPMYAVVGGVAPGEGAIIARGVGTEVVNVTRLSSLSSSPSFIVQTNYDNWLPDDQSDARRTAAIMYMNSSFPNPTSPLGLYAVASAYPVHNPHTAYTALMSAAEGTLIAATRQGLCPTAYGVFAAPVLIKYSQCEE